MKAAKRAANLRAGVLLELQDIALALAASGQPVRAVIQGESDLPTPPHIVAAGQQALADGLTKYAPGLGDAALREAIARKLQRENGIAVDPATQVYVTNGGGLGVLLSLVVAVDPGDEVLVSDPTYGPFLDALGVVGATPRWVPLVERDDQWRWDIAALERAVTPRTRAILFDTPSAPTGAVLAEEDLRAIGDIAVRHDLTIVADEVFEHLLYDDARHRSIASLDPAFAARTLSVFSFSKSYRMTGWRLGYITGPATLIVAMDRISLAFGRPAAAFVQRAGLAALQGPQDSIAEMQRVYHERRRVVEELLQKMPALRWIRPEGAFYVFVDFRAHGSDSRALSRRLIEEAGVFLTPGVFYGPAGDGWLRISFAGALENTVAALESVRDTVKRW